MNLSFEGRCLLAVAAASAPKKRQDRLRGWAASGDESVAHVHSAAGRHLAADGRGDAGRNGGLYAAAAIGATADRLPDDPGHDAVPGRQSRRRDLLDHRSAGASVRADARADRDVVVQLGRLLDDHAALRLETVAGRGRTG